MKTSTRVIYSTDSFLHKNEGQPGSSSELSFASLEDAKCWAQWNAATEGNGMLPLAGFPVHYYSATRYYGILPPRAVRSCHLSPERPRT